MAREGGGAAGAAAAGAGAGAGVAAGAAAAGVAAVGPFNAPTAFAQAGDSFAEFCCRHCTEAAPPGGTDEQ